MLSVKTLEDFGADTKEGLARCLNKEDFYLKMINLGIKNEHFEKLKEALSKNDVKLAFEDAHALKGTIGNLALTPIYEPLEKLTEILRSGSTEGTKELSQEIFSKREELLSLA